MIIYKVLFVFLFFSTGCLLTHGTQSDSIKSRLITISDAKIDFDGDFVPDKLGDIVTIAGRATVSSGILRTDQLQISLQDNTGGIFIFQHNYKGNKIHEGDSLRISGIIDQFHGLTQIIEPKIVFEDTLIRAIPDPEMLNTSDFEKYESKLVHLHATIIGKSNNTGGDIIYVTPTQDADSIISIFNSKYHANPNLLQKYIVGEKLSIIGIVSQYKTNRNANSSYQMLPRYSADISIIGLNYRIYLWIIATAIAIFLLVLLIGIYLRVKIQKRTKDLIESKQRFEYLAESTSSALLIVQNGMIVYANNSTETLFGKNKNELTGVELSLLIPSFSNSYLKSIGQHKVHRAEILIPLISGGEIWLDYTAGPIKWNNLNSIIITGVDITAKKKTENELLISNNKYKNLFQNNPQPMWIYDLKTLAYREVNDTAIAFYGYSREEFLSMTLKDIRPKEDIDLLLKDVELTINPFNRAGIWRHIKKNGEIIFVEISSHEIEHEGVSSRLVLINDITERVKTENKLIKSESSLKEAQEIAHMGDWETDLLTSKTIWSDNCYRIFGLSPNEIIPTYDFFRSRIHPDDLILIDQGLETILREKKPIDIEMRIILPGQQAKWILNRIIPSFENDKLTGLKGVNVDIDNLKRSTLALSESEKDLQLLSKSVEQSPVGIIITDANGVIEYVNPKFIATSGYSREEVIGKTSRILKSGKHKPGFYVEMWQTILSGKVWTGEICNKNKMGNLYWVNAIISPIVSPTGEITHMVAVKEDISEKKKLIAELVVAKNKAEESDRLKTAFLSNLSHEIRTPLNSILGFSELLRSKDLTDPQKDEFIKIIDSSSRRMVNTITDIVEISKIETGLVKLVEEATNLNQLISNLHKEFESKTSEKGLEIFDYCQLSEKEADVLIDKNKLESVLKYLIDNAIKFTKSGAISFGYKLKTNKLEFYVQDTGIGLTPAQTKVVFQRFTQGSSSYARDYEGVGLGLSISMAFVEMLGGKIKVKSEENKGSAFSFIIDYKPITD